MAEDNIIPVGRRHFPREITSKDVLKIIFLIIGAFNERICN